MEDIERGEEEREIYELLVELGEVIAEAAEPWFEHNNAVVDYHFLRGSSQERISLRLWTS